MPEQHTYRQVFDLDTMLERAPLHLMKKASLPGLVMPELWADWGTISTARYWGGQVQFDSTGRNIYIHPAARTIDAALSLSPRRFDAPGEDGERTIAFYEAMRSRYPGVDFWLHTMDIQGVLNTAGLVMDQEALFLAMQDEPCKVHLFLQRVTNFLIDTLRNLHKRTGYRVCGNLWPYIFFPQELGACLTEDLMPLLSRKQYQTFGLPYLRQIEQTFGGLAIHCCGAYGHQIPLLAQSGLRIRAIEFHFPDTTLEDVEPLADQAVLVPYILLHKQDRFRHLVEFYRYLIEKSDRKFRFWFPCTTEDEETLAFAREYGNFG